MIMALHGADIADPSSPPLTVCHNMGWDALADAHGFLVICPIATWKPGGHHPGAFFWESYNTDTYFPIAPDDSGFLRSLMLAMLKPPSSGGFSVDPARIFVMGMSSGAMMTHRACIDNADLVAACAPVSGMVWLGSPSPPLPNPSRPVPIIRFQGDADPTISYCGGLLSEGSEGLIPYPPVDTDIDYWLAADGLGPNPTPLCSGGQPTDVFDLDFKSSDGKIEVEFVRELGYAHVYKQWVSAAIWEFFSTHGR
jgi:polyhydroxybutyrate depolymerase